jgi:hypothetical protein
MTGGTSGDSPGPLESKPAGRPRVPEWVATQEEAPGDAPRLRPTQTHKPKQISEIDGQSALGEEDGAPIHSALNPRPDHWFPGQACRLSGRRQNSVDALLGLGHRVFLSVGQGPQGRPRKQRQVGPRGVDAYAPLGPLAHRHDVVPAVTYALCHSHLSGLANTAGPRFLDNAPIWAGFTSFCQNSRRHGARSPVSQKRSPGHPKATRAPNQRGDRRLTTAATMTPLQPFDQLI